MGKGGGGQPTSVTQTNLPEYARPFYENLMKRSEAISNQQYTPYEGQRIAGFNPSQIAAQQGAMGLQRPDQFAVATDLAQNAGMQAQNMRYTPGTFGVDQVNARGLAQFQMDPAMQVQAGQMNAPQMRAAQTGFNPALERFQMQTPQTFGAAQASQYMSPFAQNVIDVQKQAAVEDAQRGNVAQNLAAARQGTYGGARQMLAQTERERALGRQLGDIQARGTQAAFENAQQQFERDRAAGLGAQQQNLRAALDVQQLGTQTGLQTSLANLNAAQQARVQNQAASLQAQGMNQEQALRAALANQQAGINVGTQNLQALLGVQQLGSEQGLRAALANQQAGLDTQRMAEQSRQFGATTGLQGLQTSLDAARATGQLGAAQQQADLSRLQAQSAVGDQQQRQQQQILDTQYADFLRQRDYPMEQLGFFSNMIRGLPSQLGSTQVTYAQPPSMISQLGGAGLAGLSLQRLLGSGA